MFEEERQRRKTLRAVDVARVGVRKARPRARGRSLRTTFDTACAPRPPPPRGDRGPRARRPHESGRSRRPHESGRSKANSLSLGRGGRRATARAGPSRSLPGDASESQRPWLFPSPCLDLWQADVTPKGAWMLYQAWPGLTSLSSGIKYLMFDARGAARSS